MSTKNHDDRYRQTNSRFRIGLAEEMLRFRDESAVNFDLEQRLSQSAALISSGHGMAPAYRPGKMACCVCQLEKQFRVTTNKSIVQASTTDTDSAYYSVKNIVSCMQENCNLQAHSVAVNSDRFIFQIPDFKGMSCFEIAHHPQTTGLWISNPNFKLKDYGIDTRQKHEKRAYSVATSHPIYIQLRKCYGLDPKTRTKGRDREPVIED